jgi:hypothetical protein
MRYFTFSIVVFFVMACKSKNAGNGPPNAATLEPSFVDTAVFAKDTMLDFYSFAMKVPSGWRIVNDDTMPKVADATYRKRLYNKEKKLIYIISGLSAWDVSDDLETKPNTHKTHYAQLAGFKAKFFEPIKSGKGFSGFYIDSIGDIAGNAAGLSVYSENLDSVENSELMSIIRTIVVKPKPFH